MNESGRFIHDKAVAQFLDALTTQEKFPFSTESLRAELKHTFWLLNRVDSAKALAKKLAVHPVFKDYTVVLAAGDGNVIVDSEQVIGLTQDLFGDAIYEIAKPMEEKIEDIMLSDDPKSPALEAHIKGIIQENAITPIVELVKENYGDALKKSDQKRIEKQMQQNAGEIAHETVAEYHIETKTIEIDRENALKKRFEDGRSEEEIALEFDRKQKEAFSKMQETLKSKLDAYLQTATTESVQTAETNIKERKKNQKEDEIRDHLRGFARTIPSFLMAYGDASVTLDRFDKVIPDRVFKEVTSITLDQFRFLRDGGEYTDPETGEIKYFEGHLFEPIVFDDSVKAFIRLKQKLANYFDESSTEDIFDYIPPQKTNQIFTPKRIVKQMVDLLEEENPGCFDQPDKTFVDLYMKSGLYITEIVKRLFQSETMKALFPDEKERLKHIFEKQVYGLAPTEIIHKIASNYILGFDEELKISGNHFVHADALPYAKDGNLQELIDALFGE